MSFTLTLLLGFVLGGVAIYLVMRRDDKLSDIVLEAGLATSEIDVAAQKELDKKLVIASEDRKELERIDKIENKRERFKAKADYANRKNPKRESNR